jgi:hypothetical protein
LRSLAVYEFQGFTNLADLKTIVNVCNTVCEAHTPTGVFLP